MHSTSRLHQPTTLPRICRSLAASLLLAGFAACSKVETGPAADHAKTHGHGHAHVPPHGGTPVVLGKEDFHLELVRDAATGTLTVHVLDRHMEDFIRLEAPTLELQATVGGVRQTLLLHAVVNPLSNETVGDTAEFAGQADWLKTATTFDGVFPKLVIRGSTYEQVTFNFPQGNDTD